MYKLADIYLGKKQFFFLRMKLICELFRKISQNSSQLHGKCYENLLDAENKVNSQKFHDLVRNLSSLSVPKQADLAQLLPTTKAGATEQDSQAAIYIIIVICFYSLSLVFLVFFNIKFKMVFSKKLGLRNCYQSSTKHDLYDSQKQETKDTIELLFSHSSKILLTYSAANLANNLTKVNSTSLMTPQPSQTINESSNEVNVDPNSTLV